MHEDAGIWIAQRIRNERRRGGQVIGELCKGAVLQGEVKPLYGDGGRQHDTPGHCTKDMCNSEGDEGGRAFCGTEVGYIETRYNFGGRQRLLGSG